MNEHTDHVISQSSLTLCFMIKLVKKYIVKHLKRKDLFEE